MLQAVQGRTRMHMPGHKGKFPYNLPIEWDTTEISLTDDLYAPSSGILKAQEDIARFSGAHKSFILTGGSTAGIVAMLNYAVKPGGHIIIPRNAHHSVLSACVIGGMLPDYIWPETDDTGYLAITTENIVKAIQNAKDASAILITRPDYYGLCCNMQPIVDAAHAKNISVLVDEAHGTHFNWWNAPRSAGYHGADMWVQGAHKTIPALTQGAVMHVGKQYNSPNLARIYSLMRMTQTSSPSFIIMSSVEEAFFYMETEGKTKLAELKNVCTEWCEKLRCFGICPFHAGIIDKWHLEPDPTRLVADVSEFGSGYEIADALEQRGFDTEMADSCRVVAITSILDEPNAIMGYADAIIDIIKNKPASKFSASKKYNIADIIIAAKADAKTVLSPREAALGDVEYLPLADCAGRVLAQSVGIYPPGIPICCPGEVITPGMIELLIENEKRGAECFGVFQELGGTIVAIVKNS